MRMGTCGGGIVTLVVCQGFLRWYNEECVTVNFHHCKWKLCADHLPWG